MSKWLDFIALVLLIAGGLNWFLIGAFQLNVVELFWGHVSFIARSLYIVIGLAALYLLLNFKKHL